MIQPEDDATDRLIGGPPALRPIDVRRQAEVDAEASQRFWHALGFPNAADDEVVFTELDVQALRRVTELMATHEVDVDLALAMTRAFGRTADRLAVWQTQLMAEALGAPDPAAEGPPPGPTAEIARAAADRLAELAADLEPLLVYAWRRHLSAALGRMQADATPEAEEAAGTPVRIVGFADLVSFTTWVRRLSERQLASMVQRFEALASDIVTAHGGRVIKTVGDEVLFVHREVAPGAAIAIDLVESMSGDEMLPDVRVGMAHGAVVSRLGDVYGTTVNRASRLTAVTPGRAIYVDSDVARRLASVSGFELLPRRRRNLRGVGWVTPSELVRAGSARRGSSTTSQEEA